MAWQSQSGLQVNKNVPFKESVLFKIVTAKVQELFMKVSVLIKKRKRRQKGPWMWAQVDILALKDNQSI